METLAASAVTVDSIVDFVQVAGAVSVLLVAAFLAIAVVGVSFLLAWWYLRQLRDYLLGGDVEDRWELAARDEKMREHEGMLGGWDGEDYVDPDEVARNNAAWEAKRKA